MRSVNPASSDAIGSFGTPRDVLANGLRIHVRLVGPETGEPVLMLHGWPFTSHVWRLVAPALVAAGYRVIAPDLRGIGATARPLDGYDVETLSEDACQLLEALDVRRARVVGFDLGAPVAWMLAMRHPERVQQLVVMEAMIGRLPGAERFVANGPPWWFGFHSVPGLAERVLAGHEAEYLGWFFSAKAPTHRNVDPAATAVYAAAYAGTEALRGGFEHYRAMPVSAGQIDAMAASRRLTVPALAIAGGVVGDAIHRQLLPISDDLSFVQIANCGHNIPEEQPDALAAALLTHFARPV